MLKASDCLPSHKGFLGLPVSEVKSFADSKAVIVPFGLEHTVSYEKGTAHGPAAILAASPQLEMFDEELWCETYRQIGIATLKPPKVKAGQNAALVQLEDIVEKVLVAGKFPFTLGGEHALTAGAIRPFVRRHKRLTLLHFDAHADLRDGFDGEKYSHAAALRRCLDHKNVRLVSIGIRNISASEIPFLEKNRDRVRIFFAKDKAQWKLTEIIRALGNDPVYLTFDIDGFDSSMIPATGTPEPGGLFWTETMEIIRAAAKHNKIVGADVVELSPRAGLHACDFLAAKLVYKILAYSFLRR
jgi:agmatinase